MKKTYRANSVKTAGFEPVKNFIENPSTGYTLKITENATQIRAHALQYRTNMTAVILPPKLKKIGQGAFYNCDSLKEIYLPDSVEELSSSAISYCDNLRSVRIGPNLTTIGSGAFNGNEKLIEIINDSPLTITPGSADYGNIAYYALEVHKGESKVSYLNDYVFYTTSDNKNYMVDYTGTSSTLILPSSYNGKQYEINRRCFSEKANLQSVTIPSNVTAIGDYAFYDCPLTYASIGSNVTRIGEAAFKSTSISSITIPNSVTEIGGSAFIYCSDLVSVTFGSGLKKIGSYAFAYTDITDVYLPNSVTTIGNSAFYYAELKTCSIGTNVTSIGSDVFYGNDLDTITYRGTKTQWSNITLESDWHGDKIKYVSCSNGTITL